MPLRQAGLIFRAEVATSLVISPRAGEGFKVRRIFCTNASGGNQFATIINDTARVGFFRVGGYGGAHLLNTRAQEVSGNVRGTNLLDVMWRLWAFEGYPVVEGESFTVNISTGTCDIAIVADSYDAGDVKSSDTCGSKSRKVMYVNYGTNASGYSASGYYKLDSSRNPAEMCAFPFGPAGGGLVPAAHKVLIKTIGGQACARFTSAGNTAQTQYIRPRLGAAPAQTILDRNDVGLPFLGTIPGAGIDYTSVRQMIPSNPDAYDPTSLVIPELTFGANDEFSLQVQATIAGTGVFNAADIDVWVLQYLFPG